MKTYDNIKMISIKKIRPYFNNPRNNEKAVQALIRVIPAIGFNVPILIDKDGFIVKGHSRYYAATQLGMEELPCIVSENNDEKNNEDRVYDNAVQDLSDWDMPKLKDLTKDLTYTIPNLELKNMNLRLVNEEIKIDNLNISNVIETITTLELNKDIEELEKGINPEPKNDFTYLVIACRHCGGEISLNVDEILRQ